MLISYLIQQPPCAVNLSDSWWWQTFPCPHHYSVSNVLGKLLKAFSAQGTV